MHVLFAGEGVEHYGAAAGGQCVNVAGGIVPLYLALLAAYVDFISRDAHDAL
jgi:hypothetical protein